ncbi:hypothetical protein HZH66_012583 [Vespula vulgaris]|uniref:Chitin-binding type-2 domain-containing protein n=1 Tax=Vespula vulgaris TaxID=7454 RepID=A0A834MVC3_VESVU|nr:hypothetical protein HZH66_012583 [Vespula vulgaris]
MLFTIFSFYLILIVVNSSKCPEFKRPHNTNCAMFYNCINLPIDGFVWVPSKCSDNLVFQPYLKTCVLPSDTWSCDHLKNKSFSTTTNKNSNFIQIIDHQNSTRTNSKFLVNAHAYNAYNSNETSNLSNRSSVDLHPSIKIEDTIIYKKDSKYNNNHNIINPVTVNQKEENYVYEYINKRNQMALPFTSESKDQMEDHYVWINQLINRLIIYKKLLLSLDQLTLPSTDFIKHNEPVEPPESPKYSKNVPNILLKYLIQQYMFQTNYHNVVASTTKFQNFSDIEKQKIYNNDINSSVHNIIEKFNKTRENIIHKTNNNANTDNSIIMIIDDFGNKEYLTVEKYKSMAYKIKSNSIHFIPCIKEIRFANKSDCIKYYTCEPLEAHVKEFTCPDNTAFNEYTRVCDTYKYKICKEHKSVFTELPLINNTEINNSLTNNDISKEKICKEIGKTEDPTSDTYYYICYFPTKITTDIKAIRMRCPNNLKFCKSKNVCTTKQLCMN